MGPRLRTSQNGQRGSSGTGLSQLSPFGGYLKIREMMHLCTLAAIINKDRNFTVLYDLQRI